jgi:hypothetical protein
VDARSAALNRHLCRQIVDLAAKNALHPTAPDRVFRIASFRLADSSCRDDLVLDSRGHPARTAVLPRILVAARRLGEIIIVHGEIIVVSVKE